MRVLKIIQLEEKINLGVFLLTNYDLGIQDKTRFYF